MVAFLQLSILGVYLAVYAGNSELLRLHGFLFLIIGDIGSLIAYERLKEKIERLEVQRKKKNDIIENNNTKFVSDRR